MPARLTLTKAVRASSPMRLDEVQRGNAEFRTSSAPAIARLLGSFPTFVELRHERSVDILLTAQEEIDDRQPAEREGRVRLSRVAQLGGVLETPLADRPLAPAG